jgi:hypothetical protein
MRIIKSFNSVICTLLAGVLFSLTISVTMASSKNYTSGQEYSISKKGTMSANSDNQLPYEERETERDDEPQDNFSVVCLIYEPVFFSLIGDLDKGCDKGQEPVEAITDIPLYLSIRVLLI